MAKQIYTFSYGDDRMAVTYKGQGVCTEGFIVYIDGQDLPEIHSLSRGEREYIQNRINEKWSDDAMPSIQDVGNYVCEIYHGMII